MDKIYNTEKKKSKNILGHIQQENVPQNAKYGWDKHI